MGDRWTDRLSEYLDGELGAEEARALEAHLPDCPECTTTLAELRQVVSVLSALPDAPPERDLWAGIEARLPADAEPVRVVSLAERRRHFSFTLPQLAAAGITLVAASSMIVWLVVSRPGAAGGPATVATRTASPAAGSAAPPATTPASIPGPAQAAPEPAGRLAGATSAPGEETGAAPSASRRAPAPSSARLVRAGATDLRTPAERQYDAAVTDLQAVLRRERSRLQPETVQAVEKSLRDIDRAIAEARRALQRDPADPYLNDHLAESMQLKLQLLRQTAALAQS